MNLKQQKNSTNKSPGLHSFSIELYKNLRKDITPICLKISNKIESKAVLPNSFLNTSIIVVPKPDKDPTEKKTHRPIYLMNLDTTFLKKILENRMQHIINKLMINLASSQGFKVQHIY